MKTLKPDWPAPPHIKAYTTLRDLWTEKEEGELDSNRPNNKLKTWLDLPSDPIWITQKHTAIAVQATPENKDKIADASFTAQPNNVCAVLTADCLPILICNQQGTHVAAIHAGWRGLANGIIEATLEGIQQPADDLLVWLGPAIGPKKFEVGQDVFDAFISKHSESHLAFTPLREGKWLADLYALAKIRLGLQGITHIYGGTFCTYTQDNLFFSYRRDKGKTGRMVSLIWF
jgi:polyphenol oxidase